MGCDKSILLVDDSEIVRYSVRRLFEESGWTVCGEAENGQEGIEKAVDLQPSVVLLDLSMPVMNGITAARILSQVLPETRLILFTSFTDMLNSDEVKASGFSALVPKDEAARLVASAEEALQAA